MIKKSFILLIIILVLFMVLFGCTDQKPVCGDGVCHEYEQNPNSQYYCPQDCGVVIPDVDEKCVCDSCESCQELLNNSDCDTVYLSKNIDALIETTKPVGMSDADYMCI
jgi:hypothetical protein